MKWLGRPKNRPEKLKYEEGKKIIEVFDQIWGSTEKLKSSRSELAEQITDIISGKGIIWKKDDVKILEKHLTRLMHK